jgi:putative transposase
MVISLLIRVQGPILARCTASAHEAFAPNPCEVGAFYAAGLDALRGVDGIHLKVRLEQDKVCLLVMIGVRADGTKELVALADGFRESTESWAGLLRSCRRRGMAAPVLAVGDGALGFWKALREVFPDTRESGAGSTQLECSCRPAEVGAPRCESRARGDLQRRGPRPRNEGDQSVRGRLRRQVAQGSREDHRAHRRAAGVLRLPGEHWIHLRTTNPIESTFATVRVRQRVTKGPGSRAAGVAMAFKLIESAQARWRAVNAPHLVALVRAGARFEKGKLVERPDQSGGNQQVA